MHQFPKLFNQDSSSFRNSELHIYNVFGSEAPRNDDSINLHSCQQQQQEE